MIEVRVPISPTASMFNRVRLITHSIRSLGPAYADAHIRVTVGSLEPEFDIPHRYHWAKDLGIEWHWLPKSEFSAWQGTANAHIATMSERLKPPFTGDRIVLLDADVLAVNPWGTMMVEGPWVGGVMAHVSPFHDHDATWKLCREVVGLDPHAAGNLIEHSGWGIMEYDVRRRYSRPYFNTGVVLADAAALTAMYDHYMSSLAALRKIMNSYFVDQIAFTLAMELAGVNISVLPPRFNFPNQIGFDHRYPEDLADIKFLHFLRLDTIDRERDFASMDAMRKLIARTDLRGSNEILRRRIAQLLPLMEQ